MRRRFRFAPLIDHLIGGRQHRFRDGKADQTPFGVRANAATARSISPASPSRVPERALRRMHALYRERYSDFMAKHFQ
jgi:hypothetical protein